MVNLPDLGHGTNRLTNCSLDFVWNICGYKIIFGQILTAFVWNFFHYE